MAHLSGYEVRPWWHGFLAFAACLAVLAVATITGKQCAGLADSLFGLGEAGARPPGFAETAIATRLAAALFGFQAATIVLTAVAVAGTGARHLSLAEPKTGWPDVRPFALWFFIGIAAYTLAVFVFDRAALAADMRTFDGLLDTGAAIPLAIVAIVGAPVAEELLFRGLLFGVVRETRAGFWGAAVLSSALWAALHADYSTYGIAEIFCIGIVFAGLRERTGSLLAPMLLHAAYNFLIVALLALVPASVLAS